MSTRLFERPITVGWSTFIVVGATVIYLWGHL